MKSELIYAPSGFKDRLNKLRTHRKDAYWEIIARYLPEDTSGTQNTPTDNLTEIEKKELGLSPVTSTTTTSQ